MAFKSVAQRNRAVRMMDEGKITPDQFRDWDAGTPEDLPERLHPKKGEAKEDQPPAGWLPTPGPEDMA